MQGWIPKWLYFVKFEGMSEDEAKAICAEAEAANMDVGLFGGSQNTAPSKKSEAKKDDKGKDKKDDKKKD